MKITRFGTQDAQAGRLGSTIGFDAMTDHEYLVCQVGIICCLLFLCAVAAVSQHPQWFG
jgi:hypothetical protein